ncbi:MAG: ABC transporter substrate-binding protein [Treponema sp.]|nr:ABC transporter substrate-binding protein [Treponema sp.]MBO6219564.1 ABC transporter substrate-binding protein [Treponema sp.]
MKQKSSFIILGTALFVMGALAVLFVFKDSPANSAKSNSEETTRDRLILGFSQIGSESAWRTRNTKSIFEAAEANDIQIIFNDAQQKQSNQLKAIRSFIVYQVDVIAFVPIVADGWDNVLQEAKEAGIPVIIVDRQINAPSSLYAGFLGENGFEEGCSAGKFLVEKCRDKDDEKISILELSGTVNSSVATGRAEGFRSIIKDDSRFSIIHSVDGDFLRSRGKEIMDNIIEENDGALFFKGDSIDVIYSHNDSMTLGLLDSLKEHFISPSSVIIISIDAEQKSIDALKEGKLNCVVECNPNLGPPLMKLVLDIAAGKKINPITYTEETVFTENDDFSLYTPRGY